jgi:hypothetical protein
MTQLNLNFDDWQTLDKNAKIEIINNVWNPYKPEIGFKLKSEIVQNFVKLFADKGIQYGIANFGWGVYMLYIVVKDSKTRIPKEFSGLLVNKGIIKSKLEENEFVVKFGYGGTSKIKIDSEILIM